MTPPDADVAGHRAGATDADPAVSSCPEALPAVETLRRRSDFLRAARARRQSAASLLLQARKRRPDEGAPAEVIRVGFTCSRKIGNAVTRNRAKRRLRAAARALLPRLGRPGWDYVLVGRPGATNERDFALLLDDLHRALERIHAPRPQAERS